MILETFSPVGAVAAIMRAQGLGCLLWFERGQAHTVEVLSAHNSSCAWLLSSFGANPSLKSIRNTFEL